MLNVFWINVPWTKNKTVNIVVVYVSVLWNDEFRNRLEIRWPMYSRILDRCRARGDVTAPEVKKRDPTLTDAALEFLPKIMAISRQIRPVDYRL
jgi:hypothetical protein